MAFIERHLPESIYCSDYRNYRTHVMPSKEICGDVLDQTTPSKTLTQTTKFRISPTASFVNPGSLVLGLSKVLLRTHVLCAFVSRVSLQMQAYCHLACQLPISL